jgi:hypothetical protein
VDEMLCLVFRRLASLRDFACWRVRAVFFSWQVNPAGEDGENTYKLLHNRFGYCATIPQGQKPAIFLFHSGTAEAVPFQNRVMKQLLEFVLP